METGPKIRIIAKRRRGEWGNTYSVHPSFSQSPAWNLGPQTFDWVLDQWGEKGSASLVAQTVKNLTTVRETRVWSETAVLSPALVPFSDYPLCPYRSARTSSSGAQSCFTCCSYHLISPFKTLLSTLTYTLWYTAKPCFVLCNLAGKVLPERDKEQARRDFFQLSHLCFFSLVTKAFIRVIWFFWDWGTHVSVLQRHTLL